MVTLVPITLNIVVTDRNSKPCIELRRVTTEEDIIKLIISSAYNNKAITVLPKFTDQARAFRALVNKGIIYRKKDQFYFTF